MPAPVQSAVNEENSAPIDQDRVVISREWLWASTVVAVGVVSLWLFTGVGGLDILLYTLYLAGAVVVPGILTAAVLDRRPLGLIHVAVGIPLGFAQSMIAFVLLAVIGLRGAAPWAPLVIGAVTGIVLARRSGGLTGPRFAVAGGWRGGALPLAAIALVAVGLMASAYFPQNPLPSGIGSGATYYPDLVWHIGNVVSLEQHWPPRDLRAVGQPLKYYVGDYVQAAQTSLATGVQPATLVLRLDPVFQLTLVVLQLFWLGRVLGKKARIGVLAALLTLLVGDLSSLDRSTSSLFDSIFLADAYVSPTYLLGLVFFIPILGVAAEWLRRGGRIHSSVLVTLALLTFGAGLTKTMALAVLLAAGAGLVIAEGVQRRRLSAPGLVLAGFSGVTYVGLSPLTHRQGDTASMSFHFLGTVSSSPAWRRLLNSAIDVVPHHPIVALIVMLGTAPVLLIGVVALIARRHGRLTQEELLLAFAAAGGAGITLLFTAPGAGQLFFWHYGYVALGVLGALGLDIVVSWRPGWWRRFVLAIVLVLGALGIGSIVLQSGPDARAVVATVVPGVPGPFHVPAPVPPDLTQPVLQGLLWLRTHTAPGAVIAVNNQSNIFAPGFHRDFYYSAFSERQILLEGYDYTPAFHDPTPAEKQELERRLSLIARIYDQGSVAAIREVQQRYGVGFLLVDERVGSLKHVPASVVKLVFSDAQLRIYAIAPRA